MISQDKALQELAYETIALLALTLTMAFLWQHNILLTGIYLAGFIAALLSWKRNDEIILFVVVAVLFQAGEMIIAHFGAWTYNNPTYLGIPMWIPLSWGYVAVIIKRLSETLSAVIRICTRADHEVDKGH